MLYFLVARTLNIKIMEKLYKYYLVLIKHHIIAHPTFGKYNKVSVFTC